MLKRLTILALLLILLLPSPTSAREGSGLVQTWQDNPPTETEPQPTAEPVQQPEYLQPMGMPWADTSDAGYCPGYEPSGGFGWDGRLRLPVAGYTAVRAWGWLGPGHGYHGGIDFSVPVGTPVHAAEGGRVVWAGHTGFGFGELVVLAHGGGYLTLYAHLQAVGVQCGAYVNTGGFLGYSGQSGAATWPHLHFEVRRAGLSLDPALWLGSA